MFRHIALTLALPATLFVAAHALADGELRDPTRPQNVADKPAASHAPRFVVSAIFISDDRRVAVLNGRAVSVGDSVDGATVRDVNAHNVVLAYRGRTISARLDLAKIRE